jgi:hypothetical protein
MEIAQCASPEEAAQHRAPARRQALPAVVRRRCVVTRALSLQVQRALEACATARASVRSACKGPSVFPTSVKPATWHAAQAHRYAMHPRTAQPERCARIRLDNVMVPESAWCVMPPEQHATCPCSRARQGRLPVRTGLKSVRWWGIKQTALTAAVEHVRTVHARRSFVPRGVSLRIWSVSQGLPVLRAGLVASAAKSVPPWIASGAQTRCAEKAEPAIPVRFGKLTHRAARSRAPSEASDPFLVSAASGILCHLKQNMEGPPSAVLESPPFKCAFRNRPDALLHPQKTARHTHGGRLSHNSKTYGVTVNVADSPSRSNPLFAKARAV